MSRSSIAVKKFNEGFNCAQSVVYGFSDLLGNTTEVIFKVATGFGAGMGRKQEICGAISGGIMVISLRYGRSLHDNLQSVELTYDKVRELIDRFTAEFGTVKCRQLLDDCDLLTPEGRERFKIDGKIEKCRDCVDYTVRLVETIIAVRQINQ